MVKAGLQVQLTALEHLVQEGFHVLDFVGGQAEFGQFHVVELFDGFAQNHILVVVAIENAYQQGFGGLHVEVVSPRCYGRLCKAECIVEVDARALEKRDVADDDTRANRDEQHGLELEADGQENEEDTHQNHNDVTNLAVSEARQQPEVTQTFLQAVFGRHFSHIFFGGHMGFFAFQC